MLAVLGVSLTLTGCALRETVRLEADPGAVIEAAGIGRVVAEVETEEIYKNIVQVTDVMVVDVGTKGTSEAIAVANQRLSERGWRIVAPKGDFIHMESAKWDQISVWIESLKGLNGLADWVAEDPQIKKAKDVCRLRSDSCVLLSVIPYR
ncbi:hypothetical protein HNP84_001120 [Thermocatellispora tengchongensis]|uniref:Uncharacterized protein n=1 Tax=Thermocatellispora tengchongensis TaxID=1073253 RepID=A0A840NS02_9ACTN|nr:hypothetical protein [Thermocatellispora tengchongensis]MBB5131414.1 hypothetical protein [Thermocatellispora tengchongensis]